MNDPTDDGGYGGSSNDSIKRNVTGGEGESDNPCDGGVLMSIVINSRRHEYVRIARMVLVFPLIADDFVRSTLLLPLSPASPVGSLTWR